MFIGIVGGFDRDASKLVQIGRDAGHQVQCHTGVISGGATAVELRNLVGRSDFVVIVTELNSHGAVRLARSFARRSKRPTQLIRRLGPTQFAAMLQRWIREPSARVGSREVDPPRGKGPRAGGSTGRTARVRLVNGSEASVHRTTRAAQATH